MICSEEIRGQRGAGTPETWALPDIRHCKPGRTGSRPEASLIEMNLLPRIVWENRPTPNTRGPLLFLEHLRSKTSAETSSWTTRAQRCTSSSSRSQSHLVRTTLRRSFAFAILRRLPEVTISNTWSSVRTAAVPSRSEEDTRSSICCARYCSRDFLAFTCPQFLGKRG